MSKIECNSELETAIWAATYAAEFVAKTGSGDLYVRTLSAISAANAAVKAFREAT